jgi:Flp pilus assembly protein TadG
MKLRTHFLAFASPGSDRGSAAIEFGFVAPIFFVLMLGILEIGVMTFAQFALQNSVTDAARLIRTGQAQQIASLIGSDIPVQKCTADGGSAQTSFANEQDWFKQQICCGVDPLISQSTCSSGLVVTVASPSSGFGGSFNSLQDPGTVGTFNGAGANAACSIVLVRATYVWTVWFPGLAQILNSNLPDKFLVNVGNNGRLLSGTSAFRNEPFTSGVAGC